MDAHLLDLDGAYGDPEAGDPAISSAVPTLCTGDRSIGVACDVTERASVDALAERAWAALGRVDLLCNNAGVGTLGAVADTPLRDAEWLFAVNVLS